MHHALPFSITEEAGGNDRSNNVENEEANQETSITPSVVVVNVEWRVELVADGVFAIATAGRVIGVVQVSASQRNEVARPLLAGLARRGGEDVELVVLALDRQSVKLG